MVKFRLGVFEFVRGASGRIAGKIVEWPVLPRKGENVWIKGNAHEVQDVAHELDKPNGIINVWFSLDEGDFAKLVSDPEWRIS